MFSNHPILDEIKKGFKLRPTKTVDKSKPIIYAEGEDESEVAPTKRAPPSGILPPGQSNVTPFGVPPPPPPPTINAPAAPPPPPFQLGPDGIPPPPPPPPILGGAAPPPPPPPPPMFGDGAAPPPPAPAPPRAKTPLNPKLANLGGKSPVTVDRGELLKGIQGGFKLRKTVTNDKSGLVVDDEMREKSVTLVEPAPTPAYIPPPKTQQARPHSSLGFGSEDNRFRVPEPRDDSPEPLLGQRRPIVMRQKGAPPPPPPEFGFDSEKQKITTEDIEKEIKKGSVASKMAALMGNMGFSQDKIDKIGTGSLPRPSFRPSPMRSTFLSEVNNNKGNEDGQPKPKPVSKWAPVDTNYGLRKANQANVPLEKQERAASVMRERSTSWLDLTNRNAERARTQSPIPFCERLELDKINIDEMEDIEDEPEEVEEKKEPVKKTRHLPDPISVKTDFNRISPPKIEETPPTPAQKKSYGYSRGTSTYRSSSPANEPSSPISSSMSSAPSPSSLSAGSVSPEQVKKRQPNPNFEKAKEKWGAVARSEERRDSKTPTRDITPTPTTAATKENKVNSSNPVEPAPCFAVVAPTEAEAKGAAAVAKTKTGVKKKKRVVKKTSTASTAPTEPVAPAPDRKDSTNTTNPINTGETTRRKSSTPVTEPTTTRRPWGQPEVGTVRDRANKFREQLQADEEKGKKPWQPYTRITAREQLFASDTLPRRTVRTHERSQPSRVVNVPINAPWYSTTTSSKYRTTPYRISYDNYSVPPPSQMRDHLRFNIDLSHDLPLSISRR